MQDLVNNLRAVGWYLTDRISLQSQVNQLWQVTKTHNVLPHIDQIIVQVQYLQVP